MPSKKSSSSNISMRLCLPGLVELGLPVCCQEASWTGSCVRLPALQTRKAFPQAFTFAAASVLPPAEAASR